MHVCRVFVAPDVRKTKSGNEPKPNFCGVFSWKKIRSTVALDTLFEELSLFLPFLDSFSVLIFPPFSFEKLFNVQYRIVELGTETNPFSRRSWLGGSGDFRCGRFLN